MKQLRPLATPADTDLAALASALVSRGATDDEARSLVEWLGADAIVLIG